MIVFAKIILEDFIYLFIHIDDLTLELIRPGYESIILLSNVPLFIISSSYAPQFIHSLFQSMYRGQITAGPGFPLIIMESVWLLKIPLIFQPVSDY